MENEIIFMVTFKDAGNFLEEYNACFRKYSDAKAYVEKIREEKSIFHWTVLKEFTKPCGQCYGDYTISTSKIGPFFGEWDITPCKLL